MLKKSSCRMIFSLICLLCFIQLAAPEEYMLVSSSLDRTLRIWDLRRFVQMLMHVIFACTKMSG